MKILLMLAKAAMGLVWGVLILNIVKPFPDNAAIALYIITGFLFFMHALQMGIFVAAFSKQFKLSGWDKISILIFGVFALIGIRQKHMPPPAQ